MMQHFVKSCSLLKNLSEYNKTYVLSKMLKALKPGETVAGKKTMSVSERLEAKKKGNVGDQVYKVAQSRKEPLNTLTGYADQLLTTDEYNIYEDTF